MAQMPSVWGDGNGVSCGLNAAPSPSGGPGWDNRHFFNFFAVNTLYALTCDHLKITQVTQAVYTGLQGAAGPADKPGRQTVARSPHSVQQCASSAQGTRGLSGGGSAFQLKLAEQDASHSGRPLPGGQRICYGDFPATSLRDQLVRAQLWAMCPCMARSPLP